MILYELYLSEFKKLKANQGSHLDNDDFWKNLTNEQSAAVAVAMEDVDQRMASPRSIGDFDDYLSEFLKYVKERGN